ncbi:hypothetical protein [Chitinophaga sp. S165]|uniref:hypothetical protein n=1 Tax=Chitinophaga sp. S165 TaxID=2135462 RepID=UPI000D71C3CF|nr:hypothetical protein [Chitinophaga sp. S165]PWV56463.1 hypothetical protein C7475_101979 [Chitinophaga sp. S165]
MAILNNKSLEITGSLGILSLYKRKDSDKIIARTKGGPSRKQIQKSPKFARTRLNNDEFGDAAKGGCFIRGAIFQIRHLADYNFTPTLNALCRSIFKLDMEKPIGARIMHFSQYRHLLDGFNLNRRYPFNAVVKPPVYSSIDRDTATATIHIPELLPNINLTLPWQYPMYRIILSIGIIEDGLGADSGYIAKTPLLLNQPATTGWRLATQTYKEETIVVQPDIPKKLRDGQTLLVSIGIEMGTLISDSVIERVKHAGSGKILMAG